MGRGIGELITCPDILEMKKIHFQLLTATRHKRLRFDIPLGPTEVIRLHAVHIDVKVAAITAGSIASCRVGLSYQDIPLTDSATAETDAIREGRNDLFFDSEFAAQISTIAGVYPMVQKETFLFEPCKCLVRSPTVDMVYVNTPSSNTIDIYVSLYYTKIGVVSGVLTQLLKVYNDVKKIYRQL